MHKARAVAAVCALILAMLLTVHWATVGEKPMDINDFILLWFREILILGAVVVGLVGTGLTRIWKTLDR